MDQGVTGAIVTGIFGVIAGVLGGGSMLSRWLDRKIERERETAKSNKEYREKLYKIKKKREHASSRALFWINHGIEAYEADHPSKKYWNGNLKKAIGDYEEAEREEKDLERERLAKMEEE